MSGRNYSFGENADLRKEDYSTIKKRFLSLVKDELDDLNPEKFNSISISVSASSYTSPWEEAVDTSSEKTE